MCWDRLIWAIRAGARVDVGICCPIRQEISILLMSCVMQGRVASRPKLDESLWDESLLSDKVVTQRKASHFLCATDWGKKWVFRGAFKRNFDGSLCERPLGRSLLSHALRGSTCCLAVSSGWWRHLVLRTACWVSQTVDDICNDCGN